MVFRLLFAFVFVYLRVCLFDRWCACSSACKLACLLACLLDSRPVEHAMATKIQIGSACTKLRPCPLRLSVRLCCGRDKMSKYYPGSKKCYVPPLCVPIETDEDIMFHLLAELDNVATCSSRRNNTKKSQCSPGWTSFKPSRRPTFHDSPATSLGHLV